MDTLTTRTGFTYPLLRAPGTCAERLVGGDGAQLIRGGRVLTCDRPADRLSVDLRELRRGVVSACYCEDRHGGEARALDEIARDPLVLAPPSVGDAESVQEAGNRGLTSREAYVVIRPEAKASTAGYVWLAFLGIGSFVVAVENPHATPRLDKLGKPLTRRGPKGERIPRGTKAFPDMASAQKAAVEAWRRNLDEVVASITRARGGTLAWGVDVVPLPEPIVLHVEIGNNGWDAAVATPRRGPVGISAITGVRPTGECA